MEQNSKRKGESTPSFPVDIVSEYTTQKKNLKKIPYIPS